MGTWGGIACSLSINGNDETKCEQTCKIIVLIETTNFLNAKSEFIAYALITQVFKQLRCAKRIHKYHYSILPMKMQCCR